LVLYKQKNIAHPAPEVSTKKAGIVFLQRELIFLLSCVHVTSVFALTCYNSKEMLCSWKATKKWLKVPCEYVHETHLLN